MKMCKCFCSRLRLTLYAGVLPVLLLPVCRTACAESANDRTVRLRHIPEGWTEPEVTAGSSTKGASFKPSVPSGFKTTKTGALTGVESVTIHENTRRSKVRRVYHLRLPDGRRIGIRTGDTVTIKGRRLKFLGERYNAMWFKDLESGRLLRMARRSASPSSR